ncbi:hypothetical protein MM221_16685 [Salipaludibacillus sp. LMS25]|uniref:cytochrome bd oxidase small subunit CydS n=1 Tax=Salipaludibacillus sp. LMS25 TaxID=2924031 RepID=UPI0020D0DB1B|nr:hypothetical protein [Salipaludibacillus sp. LMS25]UTR14187.1 hypothetical protein MM221_16685 [Salipaludibacillus sp. LMS25]
MDLTTFLIMVAPPLVVVLTLFIVFFWGAKGKPPSFIQENENNEGAHSSKQNN